MNGLFTKPKIFTSNQLNTGTSGATPTADITVYKDLSIGATTVTHSGNARSSGSDVWSLDTTLAVALVNDTRTQYIAHIADATEHTTAADGVNLCTVGAATDWDSAYLLAVELMTRYTLHNADANLVAGWAYHAAQNVLDHNLTFVAIARTSAAVTAAMNEIKAQLNAHDADGTSHGTDTLHQVTAADTAEYWTKNSTYIIREDSTDLLNNVIIDSLVLDYVKVTLFF